MEWLTSILSGGTSAVFGGILGAVGGVAQKWLDYRQQIKMAEMQGIEKDKERAHDLACMQAEAEKAAKITAIQEEGEIRVADLSALQESIKGEAAGATWSTGFSAKLSGFWANLAGMLLVCVDVVRGLTRPGITLTLVAIVGFMFWRVSAQTGALTATDAASIYKDIINMTLFLAATAVSWWFGSRAPVKGK